MLFEGPKQMRRSQCSLLLLMNANVLHKAHPTDSYISLWMHYTKPIPAAHYMFDRQQKVPSEFVTCKSLILQYKRYCLLLLMNANVLHKAHPTDSYISLWLHYTRSIPTFCSYMLDIKQSSQWICQILLLTCKNFITSCTFIHNCMVGVIITTGVNVKRITTYSQLLWVCFFL